MKEFPILFKGPLVRAILEGRKTVTRRLVKPAPQMVTDRAVTTWEGDPAVLLRLLEQAGRRCPYGQPGDRLWVRETFATLGNEDGVAIDWNDNMVRGDERGAARIYKASCQVGDYGLWQIPDKAFWKPDTDGMQYEGTWRPSIHMPRWASRILLEITDVRVERLQDITEDQARAEGAEPYDVAGCDVGELALLDAPLKEPDNPYRNGFALLWESTGARWADNAWVWVIEFRRIKPSFEVPRGV